MHSSSVDRHRPTTRSDVARLAGVSTAVVSYVVNGGPRGVAPDTRERVLRAIEVLNYRPNSSARALKRGATHLLGVVAPDIENPFYAEFVSAIDAAAYGNDRSVLLALTYKDPDREFSSITNLVDRGVDALIMLAYLQDKKSYAIAESWVPRVMIHEAAVDHSFPIVGPDLRQGTEVATRHLIEHGHTRIAYVGGEMFHPRVDYRRMTWASVLNKEGLPTTYEVRTSWDRQGGAEATHDLLSLANPPTAILAGSDLIAVGALQAIHALGLDCPRDVAVITIDGTSESQFSWPALTAVRQPFEVVAKTALETLLSPSSYPDSQIFPMELIIRNSCGCPPPSSFSSPDPRLT